MLSTGYMLLDDNVKSADGRTFIYKVPNSWGTLNGKHWLSSKSDVEETMKNCGVKPGQRILLVKVIAEYIVPEPKNNIKWYENID